MSRHREPTDWPEAGGPATDRLVRTRIPTALAAVIVAVSLMLAQAPLMTAAEVDGWSLTADPTTMTAGVVTNVAMRLTDTDGSGDIGCLRMSVPAASTVLDVAVTATSAPSAWVATRSGTGPTAIRVYNSDGNGKLKGGDWVDFQVTVQTAQAGTYSWSANVTQGNDCSGSTFLDPITLAILVTAPDPTPSPTPDPTPSPTPDPTPSPTPDPTPSPTPDPTPSPTPDPTPSPTPDPTPTPTPDPTPTPTPDPTPTPTPDPTPTPNATPSPTLPPAPTPDPTPASTEGPTPTATPQTAPTPTPSVLPTSPPAASGTPNVPAPPASEADAGSGPPGSGDATINPGLTSTDQPDPTPSSALSIDAARHSASAVLELPAIPAEPVRAQITPPAPSQVSPEGSGGPGPVVGDVFSAAVQQMGTFVRTDAAVAVAAEFTFPLALAIAVLLFLVVQDQVDRRDPKLRMAPQHTNDTLIRFQTEDRL